MTREQCKKLLEAGVLQGWAEGGTLQCINTNGEWTDCLNPVWSENAENYRLKPKPREWWVPEWDRPGLPPHHGEGLRDEKSALRNKDLCRLPDRWIKVREVEE